MALSESVETYSLATIGLIKGLWEVSTPAEKGWACIGAFVVGFDLLSPETLSEGVDRALEAHKWITTTAIGYTACHLLNLLPENLDLFHQSTELVRRLK